MELASRPTGLRVRALRVIGNYTLDLRFDDNQKFFVLQGENTSGKTTFMKLIVFALGGEVSPLIPELSQSRLVLLEVLLAGNVLTFGRYIKGVQNLVYVCEGTLDQFSDADSTVLSTDGRATSELFQDFLMEKLGLRDRQIIKRRTSDVSRLSWDQLLGLIYVDQDTPASAIYWTHNESEPRELKRKRVEVVFDLKLDQIDDLEVERSRLGRSQSQKDRELAGIHRVLGDLGLSLETGLLQLTLEMDKNQEERANTAEAISQIKSEMRSRSTHLDQLRFDIAALTDNLTQIENESILTLGRIQDYQRLLNELHVEEQRAASAALVSASLSGLRVDTCPYCLQGVDPTPSDSGICPVCHQHIESVELDGESENAMLSLADKAKDIEAALSHEQQRMTELVSSRKVMVADKGTFEQKLNAESASMIAPFLSDLEGKYEYAQLLEKQAEELKSKLRAYEQMQAYKEEISGIREQLKHLNAHLRTLKELVQQQLPRYLSIMAEALYEFLADGVLPHIQKVEVHPRLFVPLIDDREIGGLDSASAKVVARLGFFYSLLALACQTEVKHPRILLLDSPRDKDLDKRKFDLIVAKFLRLIENSTVNCQVIMTTSEITEHLEPFVFMKTLASPGGYLLIKKDQQSD